MNHRLYARISLDTATSGSVNKQLSTLRQYVAGDAVEYVDTSVSASKIPLGDRPAGARLLADLKPSDVVLVTKIDRLARNVRDLLNVVEFIQKRGASIRFTEQNIDTSGPIGTLTLTILGAMAEFEAALISERRRESLAKFREEGRHATGRAPLGLVAVPNPDPSKRGLVLRPDPELGPLVRETILDVVDGRLSQREGAKILGIRDPHMTRLMRNERLYGITTPGAATPKRDADQALFSAEEWARVVAHMARPVKAWSKAQGIGSALRCAVCGERLYFQRQKDAAKNFYRCKAEKHAPGEPRVTVRAANAEAYVEATFRERFGAEPETYVDTTETDSAKAAAVAEARLAVAAAKAALDDAEDDEAEDEAFAALKAAKKALKAAEALPASVVSVVRSTGRSMAEALDEAADDDERAAVLAHFGAWVVVGGRRPMDEKILHADEALGSSALSTPSPMTLAPGSAPVGAWSTIRAAEQIVADAAKDLDD